MKLGKNHNHQDRNMKNKSPLKQVISINMTPMTRFMRINRPLLGASLMMGLSSLSSILAQSLYYDSNGATDGFNNVTGNWSSLWSTDSAGNSAVGAWVDGGTANISLPASGTTTITLDQDATLGGLTMAGVAGSMLTIGASAAPVKTLTMSGGTINIESGRTTTIATHFQGNFTKSGGTGTLSLGTGATAWNGTANINAGLFNTSADRVNSGSHFVLGSAGTFRQTVSALTIGNLTGSGTVEGQNLAPNKTLTVTQSTDGTFSGTLAPNAHGTGTMSFIKAGAANWTLAGATANTYDGTFTVEDGKVTLAKTAGVDALTAGAITASGDGIIELAASNQINNAANLTLGGTTTLSLGGAFSESLGTLTITTGDVVIDFGAGLTAQTLSFADSSATLWTGTTLSIYNWGAGDALNFGSSATALTADQLAKFRFYTDSGSTLSGPGGGTIDGTGSIAAVPEPSTYLMLLLGFGLLHFRKKIYKSSI